MDSPDDICFKGNSALECNCTSSPPELPPKPSFCIKPCRNTTTTPPPTTTTGTTTETPTTTPGTPPGTTTVMTESPPITTTASSSNPPLETFSTGLSNSTSPNSTETIPLITTENSTCNETIGCNADSDYTASAALIAGCVCGAVAIIFLCGILIWYLWKNKKCCFAPVGSRGKNGSKECLADHEENNVELTKVEKKGTVILTPVTNPTVMPGPLPPIPNSEITPVNHPSTEETSPSHSTGSKPGNATSKKKKKLSRSNRVSPEPIPGPTSPKGGGGG